jgi:Pyridoxamine 5'-phosphate oxidase
LGKSYSEIEETVARFIRQQHVFFVATAPNAVNGHINVSPKGLDSFRILDTRTVAYLDVIGSGVETIAHAKENGRIVLMFCAFEGPPNIVRLHGRARVLEARDPNFSDVISNFPAYESTRAIIVVDVTRVSSSCGYGVPLMKYEGERSQLFAWAQKKSPEELKAYKREKNARSIDGLAGISE